MSLFSGDGLIGKFFNPSSSFQEFRPSFAKSKADVEKIRELRDKPIDELREEDKIQLEQIDVDKGEQLAEAERSGAARFKEAKSRLAQSGGIDSGARERLSRSNTKATGLERQSLFGDINREKGAIRANSFADQRASQERALFGLPSADFQLETNDAKIEGANLRASTLAKASDREQRKARFGAFGSLLGGGSQQSSQLTGGLFNAIG